MTNKEELQLKALSAKYKHSYNDLIRLVNKFAPETPFRKRFNCMRMALSLDHGTEERFTLEEIAEMQDICVMLMCE